jgi:hypothetical protein
MPTVAFLHSVEQDFAVQYPQGFKTFCNDGGTPDVPAYALDAAGVLFISDLHRLQQVRAKVWDGMLPFATQDDSDSVFGFNLEEPGSDQVLVWSIHAIVYSYPSLAAFCVQVTFKTAPQEPVDLHGATNLASWKRELLFYQRLVHKRHLTHLAPLVRLLRSLSESPTARAFSAEHLRATLVVSARENHDLLGRQPSVQVAIESGCRFAIKHCDARGTLISSQVVPEPEAEATLRRLLSMLARRP